MSTTSGEAVVFTPADVTERRPGPGVFIEDIGVRPLATDVYTLLAAADLALSGIVSSEEVSLDNDPRDRLRQSRLNDLSAVLSGELGPLHSRQPYAFNRSFGGVTEFGDYGASIGLNADGLYMDSPEDPWSDKYAQLLWPHPEGRASSQLAFGVYERLGKGEPVVTSEMLTATQALGCILAIAEEQPVTIPELDISSTFIDEPYPNMLDLGKMKETLRAFSKEHGLTVPHFRLEESSYRSAAERTLLMDKSGVGVEVEVWAHGTLVNDPLRFQKDRSHDHLTVIADGRPMIGARSMGLTLRPVYRRSDKTRARHYRQDISVAPAHFRDAIGLLATLPSQVRNAVLHP